MVAQASAPGCREKGAGLDVSQVTARRLDHSSRNLLSRNKNKPCTNTQMETDPRWQRRGREQPSAKAGAHAAPTSPPCVLTTRRRPQGTNKRRLADAETTRNRAARTGRLARTRTRGQAAQCPSPKGTVLWAPHSLSPLPSRLWPHAPFPTLRGTGGSGPERRGSGAAGVARQPRSTAPGGSPDALPTLCPSDCSCLRGAAVRGGAGPGGAGRGQSTAEHAHSPPPPPRPSPPSLPCGPRSALQLRSRRLDADTDASRGEPAVYWFSSGPLRGVRSCRIMSASMRLHSAA